MPTQEPRRVSRAEAGLSLQQLLAAAERLETRARGSSTTDWLECAEEARDRLLRRPFCGDPLHGFHVQSKGGKVRDITPPSPVERVIEEALLPLFATVVERVATDAVHGFRRGHSTFTAAAAAAEALGQGRIQVAFLDIEDYFASVDWNLLERILGRLLPPPTVEITMAFVRARVVMDGEPMERKGGLLLGRPLSAPLANLYLMEVDTAMEERSVSYLRYADDIFLAAECPVALEEAVAVLESRLHRHHLNLQAAKEVRTTYEDQPLQYLGHLIGAGQVYEQVSDRRLDRLLSRMERASGRWQEDGVKPRSNRRVQTLYITSPGHYLRVRSGVLEVALHSDEVPLHRLDRVVVLAGTRFSSGFADACINRGIPVIFFVQRGHSFGVLMSSTSTNPLRVRAQYDLLADGARRLQLAREVVSAKIRAMLRKAANRRAPIESIRELERRLSGLDTATSVEQLMGSEGAATEAYYRLFASWIQPDAFAFEGRSRHPPRDPINSMLSFAYSLTFAETQTALVCHGLDPHPGVLHALRKGHPALVSDLMEPYRVLVAEPFVLTMVNGGRIDPGEFAKRKGGATYLQPPASRRFLEAWEAYVRRPIGRGASPRDLIDGAALAFLAVVMGEEEELRLPLSLPERTADETNRVEA